MRRVIGLAVALGIALAAPLPVLGHSLIGRFESPLPLAVYLVGAGAAVALSFAFVLLRNGPAAGIAPARPRVVRAPAWLPPLVRAVGLIGWLWIIVQTAVGGSSSGEVTTLFLWVYGWVGVAILSALVGPIWDWLDPFRTMFDIGAATFRRLGVAGWEPVELPQRLAYWPAVLGFAVVVWLELVLTAVPLGIVLLAYTVLTLTAMAQFGRNEWRDRGETFSVWFALIGRLAPLAWVGRRGGRRLRIRQFGAGLFDPGWTPALLVLTSVGIGAIIFDGLSQTKPYFDLFGLPSLGLASAILAVFLAALAIVALAVARVVGYTALGAGLVPIAVGYLVAHYFTYLLLDGQRIVVALSDPLQQGWDLFGTAFYEPSLAWLPPSVVWTIQLASVVGGHVVGAWAGHAAAARSGEAEARVRLRQAPLAALMVGLTVLTLWSLGQAIVQDPGSASGPAATAEGGQRVELMRVGAGGR